MEYSKEFKVLVDESLKTNQYIGLGNPNAKILFIGKEAGAEVGSKLYHGSCKSWKEKKINYSRRFIPDSKKLKSNNHTWQKYQRIYDTIFPEKNLSEERIDYDITFVEDVFTTELSNLPAPKSSEAKQLKEFENELTKRKQLFWGSPFIKQFRVILIFASDNKYIETYPGEVCKLFGVQFVKEQIIGKSNKYWLHFAIDRTNEIFPRLVIHTRQLTSGASNELITSISKEVRKFMTQNSIHI